MWRCKQHRLKVDCSIALFTATSSEISFRTLVDKFFSVVQETMTFIVYCEVALFCQKVRKIIKNVLELLGTPC